MAELKSTTAIGGNIVWHGGNLRFDTQGETIRYSGYKIFTEHDTPLPSELGNGGSTSAYTREEADTRFADTVPSGYMKRDGDTMTGKLTVAANDIEIQGSSPRLTLTDNSGSNAQNWFLVNDGGFVSFREGSTSNTRVSLYSNEFKLFVDDLSINDKTVMRGYDAWLRINDQLDFTSGIYFGSSVVRTDNAFRVGSDGSTFDVNAMSITYKGNDVFHDAYHPNADKWTTARTITLSGDATGSVSIDGSSNRTLIVSVVNDSHTHDTRYMRVGQGAGGADVLPRKDSRSVDYLPSDYGDGVEYHFKYNTIDGFTHGGGTYHRVMNFDAWQGSSGGRSLQFAFGDNGNVGTRVATDESTWADWRMFFTDTYHPNADRWTTARTLSLSGDATGSVSIDGSENETLEVVVLNDSHTHDGRYYTEAEANARFAPINGAGYVSKSGDSMTGNLTITKANSLLHLNATANTDSELRMTEDSGQHGAFLKYDGDVNDWQLWRRTGGADHLVMSGARESNNVYMTGSIYANNTQRVFADNYHPNADKWTTARTITLNGDVSGSVSIDGSANKTLTVTVANDSHTHDGRYYTEAESNARYVSKSGDTMTGSLILGVNSLLFDTGAYITRSTNPGDGLIPGSNNCLSLWGPDNGHAAVVISANDDNDSFSVLHSTASDTTGHVINRRSFWVTRDATYAEGEIYANNTQRVFADNYHPNADKWTTARTITLSGDATGSVSIDGSANKTLTVTVANDSHAHDRFDAFLADKSTVNADTVGDVGGFSVRYLGADASNAPSGQDHAIQTNSYSVSWQTQQASDWRTNAWYVRGQNNGTWSSWERLFADNYHPNADKWTTARTITLNGDVSGSVSIDGSANKTLTVTVANDSHAHTNYMGINDSSTYRQMTGRSNSTTAYVRITSDGLLPHSNGVGALGTSTWRFSQLYANSIYEGTTALSAKYLGILDAASKVTVSNSTSSTFYPVVWHNNSNALYDTSSFKFQASTGTVLANTFQGALNGNAGTATKLNTARTISLAGDASGSVLFDGSANASITVAVANDSHTHDGRYYTEAEADARFAPLSGAGYLPLTGGTITGSMTVNGTLSVRTAIDLADNDIMRFGSSDDVEFFCNGSHMYTDLNSGIGNWYVRDGSTTRFTFDDAGHFTATGNVTAYSDIRLKSNIERIENPLEKIMQLGGYVYDKKLSLHEDKTTRETGVIAQEVEKVLPEAVRADNNDADGIKSVAYGNLSGLIIESIKELNETVNTLQNEVQELKKPWWKKLFRL
ncbi:long tail fiber protein distal subunit [Vibrio phage F86]